ncbi:hypothetical protein OH76DRAFT_1485488 [Lentinus brumalis]|uniref:Protein kinase domain-containing protein n=1 Tax=Lentinus brumalis TaxID=2498619 RepID=A0A371D1K1_9APHY|nr:hypothetical protein OH76DRAFT_1485488 [Polyporus brumalis]
MSTILLRAYPEQSPWTLDPPPAEALKQAHAAGRRSASDTSASNPLSLDNEALSLGPLRLEEYTAPPPLPFIPTTTPITFVQARRIDRNSGVLRIQMQEADRVVKLYIDSDATLAETGTAQTLDVFEREAAAYARLLHAGACASGAVPMCYGRMQFTGLELRDATASLDLQDEFRDFIQRGMSSGFKGLVLEFFTGSAVLSSENITPALAEIALKALYAVHNTYVKHGAVKRQNVVVMPAVNRVAWVGFDCATVPENEPLSRQDLLAELAEGWSMLYEHVFNPVSLTGYEA